MSKGHIVTSPIVPTRMNLVFSDDRILEGTKTQKIPTIDGNYRGFYSNVTSTIKKIDSLVVSTNEALFVMEIMELCLKSAKEEKWIPVGF